MTAVTKIKIRCPCGHFLIKRPKSKQRCCSKKCGDRYRIRKPIEVIIAKRKAYMAKWRFENRDLARRLTNDWRSRNKNKIQSYSREWRMQNKGRIRIVKNTWNRRNPEKARARAKRWKILNPCKVLDNHNRRRASCKTICPKVREIYQRCVELKRWFDVVVDHVIPLSKDGTHTAANLEIIYASENSRKNDSMEYSPSVIFK